jgi:hypothetical protein
VRERGDKPAVIIEHVTAWIGLFLKRVREGEPCIKGQICRSRVDQYLWSRLY